MSLESPLSPVNPALPVVQVESAHRVADQARTPPPQTQAEESARISRSLAVLMDRRASLQGASSELQDLPPDVAPAPQPGQLPEPSVSVGLPAGARGGLLVTALMQRESSLAVMQQQLVQQGWLLSVYA